MVSMNKLTIQKRVQILASLVEGNSIRSTVRMSGAAKNPVAKLLRNVARVCELYQRKNMANLPCKRGQGLSFEGGLAILFENEPQGRCA
jgi:hypothetical protein